MKLNYFVYNGQKYYSGSEIKILDDPYDKVEYYNPAIFLYHDPDNNIYAYKMKNTSKVYFENQNLFMNRLVGIIKEAEKPIQVEQDKRLKDWQIPKLLFGWVWYIFAMLAMTIFNGFLVGAVFVTAIFFYWRSNVIKKEGYYV